jgi:hypothetical protein
MNVSEISGDRLCEDVRVRYRERLVLLPVEDVVGQCDVCAQLLPPHVLWRLLLYGPQRDGNQRTRQYVTEASKLRLRETRDEGPLPMKRPGPRL